MQTGMDWTPAKELDGHLMSIDSSLGRLLLAAADVMKDIQHAGLVQSAGKGSTDAEAALLAMAESLAYEIRLAGSLSMISKAAQLVELIAKLGEGESPSCMQ